MKKIMLLFALPIFCLALFVSEAPAPNLPDFSVSKSCTDASAPGEPIHIEAVIINNIGYALVIESCVDDPAATFDPPVSFPFTIEPYGSATIRGYYYPTTNPSVDTITCTGYLDMYGSEGAKLSKSDSATCSYPTYEGCTRTPGYWKNHPDAWPVDSIIIGGITYSKAAAIAWLKTPVEGDKTITMFKALVAAKLNDLSGADTSCISATTGAADAWMAAHGPVGSYVAASSEAWKSGECLYGMLDAYNNGYLCVPHCD